MKKVKKSVRVYIRLTPDQHEELETAARHLGLALSSWMLTLSLREARLLPAGLTDAPPTLVTPMRQRSSLPPAPRSKKIKKERENCLIDAP